MNLHVMTWLLAGLLTLSIGLNVATLWCHWDKTKWMFVRLTPFIILGYVVADIFAGFGLMSLVHEEKSVILSNFTGGAVCQPVQFDYGGGGFECHQVPSVGSNTIESYRKSGLCKGTVVLLFQLRFTDQALHVAHQWCGIKETLVSKILS